MNTAQSPMGRLVGRGNQITVFRAIGTEADLRKRGAFETMPLVDGVVSAEPRRIEVESRWRFGCVFAGRGQLRNRVITTVPGVSERVVSELAGNTSYVPVPVDPVKGEFVAYERVERKVRKTTSIDVRQLDGIISAIIADSPGPVLVTGGHYMPYLHDVRQVRGSPVATFRMALRIVEAIKANGGVVDLGILVNDLHMGIGTATEGSRMENIVRRAFWNGFVLPTEYENAMRERLQLLQELSVLVVGERQLFNRLDHARQSDNPDAESLERLLRESESKCTGALAYLLKFARTLEYGTLIQIYPACDASSQKAIGAATAIYGADALMPKIHTIYTTIGC